MGINIFLLNNRKDIPDNVHVVAEKNCSVMLDMLFKETYLGFGTVCELVTLARNEIVGYVLVLATIVQDHAYIELHDLAVHPEHTNTDVEYELLRTVTQRYKSLIAYQPITSQYFYSNIASLTHAGFAWHSMANKTYSGYSMPPVAILKYKRGGQVPDVCRLINGVDELINQWLKESGKALTTYTINEKTMNYIAYFFNDAKHGSKGGEIGGSFVEEHGAGGRVNLTINESKISASGPGELCYLKDGSYAGIAFHTHPVFCGDYGGAYFSPPSAGDLNSCFIKHFQGLMKRYFVFSPEGIFFIRINPIFSDDLKYKIKHETPNRRNDIVTFLASLAEHSLNAYEQIFFSPDRVYSINILVGRVLSRLANRGIEGAIRTTLQSVATTDEERALIGNPDAVLDARDPNYAKKILVFKSLFIKFFFKFYNRYTSFHEFLKTYEAFDRPNPNLKISDCKFILDKYNIKLDVPVFEIVRANINYNDDTFLREIKFICLS